MDLIDAFNRLAERFGAIDTLRAEDVERAYELLLAGHPKLQASEARCESLLARLRRF